MRNNILFRHTLVLLLVALILASLISSTLYVVIQQHLYVKNKTSELMSIAKTVSTMISDDSYTIDFSLYSILFSSENKYEFLGAKMEIYDSHGNAIALSVPNSMNSPKQEDIKPIPFGMSEKDFESLANGRDITKTITADSGSKYLFVGTPILYDSNFLGAVVFTQPMSNIAENLKGFNITLFLSSLVAFSVMIFPCYLAVKKITIPITETGKVARAMAKGDFSMRADESQKGELGELAKSINIFAAESEILEQTRKDYVANVSHELKTPIAAIRAMSETLKDGLIKDDEKKSKYYNNILNESMRLSRLIDDLLELSRLQSNTAPIEKRFFKLSDMINYVYDIYHSISMESDINLIYENLLNDDPNISAEAARENEPPVYSNPDRIEQVLVILLDNAVKFTPKGGTVHIILEEYKNAFMIKVKDTGCGISEEDIEHVFERFYKADKSHSGLGTGLGLSIANETMSLLDENIYVENNHGENGCTFGFTVHKEKID